MKKSFLILLMLFMLVGCSNTNSTNNNNEATANKEQTQNVEEEQQNNEQSVDSDLIEIRNNFKYGVGTLKTSEYTDMSVCDYVEYKQNCYIGLIYAKIVDISGDNKPADGNKYLFGFYEVFNDSNDTVYLPSYENFSAYLDDSMVNEIDSGYNTLREDRITKVGMVDKLDSKCKTYILVGYEINPQFETAEFYYNDYCWSINSKDITNKKFVYSSLYDYKEDFDDRNKTDDIIETDKLSIKVGTYYCSDKDSDGLYSIAFLYDITNNSEYPYTFDRIYDDCRLYYYNYLICDEYQWLLFNDDTILDDHCYIDNVEEIKSGKTVKAYFPFEVPFIEGDFKIIAIREKGNSYNEKGDTVIIKHRVG